LAALPMWARVQVGALRVGIVHGDAQSLAGWGFSQEAMEDPAQRAQARGWLHAAQVDAFACSHSCLPVFADVRQAGEGSEGRGAASDGVCDGVTAGATEGITEGAWVLNNGAAGMPNFRGDGAGLFTRIALRPFAGPAAALRHGVRSRGVFIDAIAVDSVRPEWLARFAAQWPPGSDADISYAARIHAGPDYAPAQALRGAAACAAAPAA
jgi:hypothetical protein